MQICTNKKIVYLCCIETNKKNKAMKTFKLTMILFCLFTSTFLTKEIIELKLYNFDLFASIIFVLMPLILALILIININK